jgi:hypothetical protein
MCAPSLSALWEGPPQPSCRPCPPRCRSAAGGRARQASQLGRSDVQRAAAGVDGDHARGPHHQAALAVNRPEPANHRCVRDAGGCIASHSPRSCAVRKRQRVSSVGRQRQPQDAFALDGCKRSHAVARGPGLPERNDYGRPRGHNAAPTRDWSYRPRPQSRVGRVPGATAQVAEEGAYREASLYL